MIKRFFDFLMALILLILLGPLIIFLAIIIWAKMGRPIIFSQLRPGYKGALFNLYKFRTMTTDVDSDGRLLDDRKRLTSLGIWMRKYSLDELPQLINIISGELSFVGPRPLLIDYLGRYSSEQARRHDVKPGITGWAQINGRNTLTWEDKFRLDVWYVDNQSFWLDLKIISKTVIKVIKAEGISGAGTVTMSEFMGSEENS